MGKRRRPRTRKEPELEEGEGESGHQLTPTAVDGVSLQQVANPTPSPPVFCSMPVHYSPAPSSHPVQNANTVFDQCATFLRYRLRSAKGITRQSSIFTPTTRVLPEAINSLSPTTGNIPTLENFTSKLPVQSKVSNALLASSRSPSQHVKATPSHTRTSWLAKRGQTMENASNSVSAASEDWSITNDLLDIEKITSEILHQSQGLEKLHPDAPPSAPCEVVLDNHLPNGEAIVALNPIGNRQEECPNNLDQKDDPIQSHSLNITEMAAMVNDDSSDPDEVGSALDCALVTVNGYRVKEEFASLLRDIFSKYGDIAKGCSLQCIRSRSSFLEMACDIFQRLEGTKFTEITLLELKNMLDLIDDIELVRVEVEWLHKRLNEIYEARLLFRGSSSLKEAKTRNNEAIKQVEKEVEGYTAEMRMLQDKISSAEDKLAAMKAESEKITETVLDTKIKVKCFYQRSLVEGLL